MVNCHWFIWTRFNVDSHKTTTGRTLTTDHPSLITLRYTPHKTINGSCLRLSQVNLNSLCRNDRCNHKPYHRSPLATPLLLITPRYTPLSVTAGRAVKPLIEIGYSFVCMPIKPINIKEFPRSSLLARVIDWGLEILFYRKAARSSPVNAHYIRRNSYFDKASRVTQCQRHLLWVKPFWLEGHRFEPH